MQSAAVSTLKKAKLRNVDIFKGIFYGALGAVCTTLTGFMLLYVLLKYAPETNNWSQPGVWILTSFIGSSFIISCIMMVTRVYIVTAKTPKRKTHIPLYSFMFAIALNAVSGITLLPDFMENIDKYITLPSSIIAAFIAIYVFLAIIFHGEIQEDIKQVYI